MIFLRAFICVGLVVGDSMKLMNQSTVNICFGEANLAIRMVFPFRITNQEMKYEVVKKRE